MAITAGMARLSRRHQSDSERGDALWRIVDRALTWPNNLVLEHTTRSWLTWLRPTRIGTLLAVGGYLLVAGAFAQAWGFGDGSEPKPLLYDALTALPLWPFGVFLVAPLVLLFAPLGGWGIDLVRPDALPGALIIGLYLYLLSAAFVALVRRARRLRRPSTTLL